MPFLNNIGAPELIVIAIILLLLLFGNKKANELAKGLGQSSKELKKAKKEFQEALNEEVILKDDTGKMQKETPVKKAEVTKEEEEEEKKEEKKEGGT